MVQKKEQESLWEQVGNRCLERALALLNEETALDMNNIRAAKELVKIAVSIDLLNLRWTEQSRYGEAVFQGQILGQTAEEN